MKLQLACFEIVSLTAIIVLVAAANSLPLSFVNSDSAFRELNKNYQVVDGPKEFLVPLAPLRKIWQGTPFSNFKPEGSDLDYVVYGKVYLMKAMQMRIADRSIFPGTLAKEVSDLSANKDVNTIVLTRDYPTTTTSDKTSSKDEALDHTKEEGGGIEFPAAITRKNHKRQYKFTNAPKPAALIDGISHHHHHQSLDIRKIHERSAESTDDGTLQPSKDSSRDNDSNNHPLTLEAPKSSEEESENLDEEALELLTTLGPYSSFPQSHSQPQHSALKNDGGSSAGAINVDDRFLLQVPNKPQSSQCPEGQRKTHHGVCKPIIVHNRSSQDGIFHGRITTAASKVNGNSPSPSPGSANLAALFKTFVQLEKKLEHVLKDSERELTEVAHQTAQSENTTAKSGENS